jgi:tyrosine decarboxylase/aspartate 1-decarboxylase
MNMKLKSIPLTNDYTVDFIKLKKEISSETAAVVGIAGSTDLGVIDPIQEIGEFCEKEHIFFHVDAAYGGFIIPFLKELGYHLPSFDFAVNGVSSICLDAHKMGYAAIPLGTLVIRDLSWLKEISVESRCVSSEKQAGILGTRSGGTVAAAYAVTQYLGKKGYQDIMQECMKLTEYAKKRIQEIGLPLVYENPPLNILAIKLRNVDDIDDQLTQKGWKINKMNHLSAIRLVLKPNISTSIIDEFILELQKTCMDVGEL